MTAKNFMCRRVDAGPLAISMERSPWSTYRILMIANKTIVGTIEEDTNFVKIDAVFSFLSRNTALWPVIERSIYRG